MLGKEIKKKLTNNEYIYGTHVVGLTNSMVPEWIRDSTLDFVFICQEHMPLDRSEASLMCRMYASYGVSPMVRIPYPEPRLATIAVEGGAEGIVVPYIEKPEDITGIINALRYRPIKGAFLEDYATGRRQPSPKLAQYLSVFNENLYLVAGVESVPAIENLDAILQTDGVDAIFLGPHDISCSMGIPEEYDNPEFIDMVCSAIRKCQAVRKPVGVHVRQLKPCFAPFLEAGANFILNDSDISISTTGLREDFAQIREQYERKR